MEQEDVPIGYGEHQSLVTRYLQDIKFIISLGFRKKLGSGWSGSVTLCMSTAYIPESPSVGGLSVSGGCRKTSGQTDDVCLPVCAVVCKRAERAGGPTQENRVAVAHQEVRHVAGRVAEVPIYRIWDSLGPVFFAISLCFGVFA